MNESSWLGLGLGLFVAAFAAGAADVADFITDVIAAAAADAAAATASIASLFLSINKSNYLFFFVVPPKWATLHYNARITPPIGPFHALCMVFMPVSMVYIDVVIMPIFFEIRSFILITII